MVADPKPGYVVVARFDPKRPIVKADANRSKSPDSLELKGGMTGVGLKQLEARVRQTSHLDGQRVVRNPEAWAGMMRHNLVQRPF